MIDQLNFNLLTYMYEDEQVNLLVSILALALGIFCTFFPAKAVRIWSADQLSRTPPKHRAFFINVHRVFGIAMILAGVYFIEIILRSDPIFW